MSVTITPAEFKAYFVRDFTYGTLPDITDDDINKAIAEATAVFNCDLYPDDTTAKQAFYYCVAHFLKSDIDAATGGGTASLQEASKSVDGISVTYNIPDWMKQGELSVYASTYYGVKWMMLSKPYMDGAVYSVAGGTNF